MTTLTTTQLKRLYRHYAAESCINAEQGGTSLLIAYSYLSQMQNVLNALTNNGEMTGEDEEKGLRILELLDGVKPERTMQDDIKQIEYDRTIKVHEAHHVDNYYHIWAKRRGFDIVLFLNDEIPFRNCFWGECDPLEAQFTLIRRRIGEEINSIRLADTRLLIVETATGIRYFGNKALPTVLEYTIAETYLAQ